MSVNGQTAITCYFNSVALLFSITCKYLKIIFITLFTNGQIRFRSKLIALFLLNMSIMFVKCIIENQSFTNRSLSKLLTTKQ